MPPPSAQLPTTRRARRPRPWTALSSLSLLSVLPSLVHAYSPTDGGSQVCRVIHLDETSLPFPFAADAGAGDLIATAGAFPGITLSGNVDLSPLLEQDDDGAAADLSPFGPHASIRFDAWIPQLPHDDAAEMLCVPSSLTLIAGPGSVTVPIPSPAHGGWVVGKWHTIDAPLNKENRVNLDNGEKATWNALTRLELQYQCTGNTTKTSSSSSSSSNSIKIQLVRVCKVMLSPSFCTVASTSVYNTECRECNCQTCHKEDCKCLTTYLGTCPFDTCSDCPCVPFCQCCYESKCDYPCNCGTCCESRSFTSCATAITYGVASLAPAGGMEGGGAHVVVRSTSSFVATPEMVCRFGGSEGEGKEGEGGREGGVIVSATLLSSTTLACVAPPFDATAMTVVSNSSSSSSSSRSGRSVVVEVSLDGQQWTRSGRTFHYCPSSSSSTLGGGEEEEEQKQKEKEECLAAHESCLPGWVGKDCNLKCPGGANNPCNGGGFCVAVVKGEEGREDEEEASCVCKSGYEGTACETVASSSSSSGSSSSKIISKAIAPSSSSSESSSSSGSSSSTASSAMRQGLLLGVGACLLLLLLAGVAIYVKRAEVGEFVYWTLAATRFERLQQGQGQGGGVGVGEVEEGRGGGRRSVELTAALRREDDEEGGEVTIM